MNLFKKLFELASVRLPQSPMQVRYDISRKDWIDFAVVVIVSFLIVVYKVNKAA
jgi:hypothetical protein